MAEQLVLRAPQFSRRARASVEREFHRKRQCDGRWAAHVPEARAEIMAPCPGALALFSLLFSRANNRCLKPALVADRQRMHG